MNDFPEYKFADELMSPRELGIKRDGSFDGIMRAVGGINYYADSIAFGDSTMFAKGRGLRQTPLGIRYFVNTGMTCSNGAKMHEYVDLIPTGMPGRVGEEMKAMGLPQLKGLGPGIVEDAANSLNPLPILDAATRGGFPQCKQVTLPVGDIAGNLASRYDPKKPWITEPTQAVGGKPHQTRWVFDKWLSYEDYETTPKSITEGFTTFSIKSSQTAAIALLIALLGGIYLTKQLH
jgi:hypothetical protein